MTPDEQLQATEMTVTLSYSDWSTVRLILEHANSVSKYRPRAGELANDIGGQLIDQHAAAIFRLSVEAGQ